ncbi:MAG: hypothetical protein Athens041674_918 [Parcubacteria group bacterium Athens0416_74]|nr:MAG: hypothetical protein Athens041674_918 [Parcubacteria group bacterium Athens0416_74]
MSGVTTLSILCGCIIGLLSAYLVLSPFMTTVGTVGTLPMDATSIVTLRGLVESVDVTEREITIIVMYPGFPGARAPFRIPFDAVRNFANVSIPASAGKQNDAPSPRYDISKTEKGQLAEIRLRRTPGPFRVISLVVNKPLLENL